MKKRLLSILLTLTMVMSLLPGMTITADASSLIGTYWAVTDTADATPEYGEEKATTILDNDWAAIRAELNTDKYVHMKFVDGLKIERTLPASNNLTGAGWEGLIIDQNGHIFYLDNGPLSADFDVTIKSNSCDIYTQFIGKHGITLTGENSALTFLNLDIAAFNDPFSSTGPMTIEANRIDFNGDVSITAPEVTLKAREEGDVIVPATMRTEDAVNVFMNSVATCVFDNVTGVLTASSAVFARETEVTVKNTNSVHVKAGTAVDGNGAVILDTGTNVTVTVPAGTKYFAIEPDTGAPNPDAEAKWGFGEANIEDFQNYSKEGDLATAIGAVDSATETVYIQLNKNLKYEADTSYMIPSGKSVVLDLNKNKLEWEANSNLLFGFKNSGSLTVKNGYLSCKTTYTNGSALVISNENVANSSLSVINCEIFASSNKSAAYGIQIISPGAGVTIQNCKITATSNANNWNSIGSNAHGIYINSSASVVNVSGCDITGAYTGIYTLGKLYLGGENTISGEKQADIMLGGAYMQSSGGELYANIGGSYCTATEAIKIGFYTKYYNPNNGTVIVHDVDGNESSFGLYATGKYLKPSGDNLILADCEHDYEYTPSGGGKHNGTCKNCGNVIYNEVCTYGDDGKCSTCGGEKPYEITLDATGLLNSDSAGIFFNFQGGYDYEYNQSVAEGSTANINLRNNDDSAVVYVIPDYPLAYQNLVVTVNGVPIESTFDDYHGPVFYIDEFTGDTTITITGEATEREFESFDSTLLQSETFDAIVDGDPLPDLGEAIESAWITLVGGSRLHPSHDIFLSAKWLCAPINSGVTPYEVDHDTADTSAYDYFIQITFPTIGYVFQLDEEAMTSDSIHIINEQGDAYAVESFGFEGTEGSDNRDLFVAVVKLGSVIKSLEDWVSFSEQEPSKLIVAKPNGVFDSLYYKVIEENEIAGFNALISTEVQAYDWTTWGGPSGGEVFDLEDEAYDGTLNLVIATADGNDMITGIFAGTYTFSPAGDQPGDSTVIKTIGVAFDWTGVDPTNPTDAVTLSPDHFKAQEVYWLRFDDEEGPMTLDYEEISELPADTDIFAMVAGLLEDGYIFADYEEREIICDGYEPVDGMFDVSSMMMLFPIGTASEVLALFDDDETPAHQHSYDYNSNNNGTHNGVCECNEAPITNEECSYDDEGVCSKCGYKTYTIGGNVTVKDGGAVYGAKVELKKGNATIGEAVYTGPDGNYTFTNVPKGGYNIVVTMPNSGKTKTSHVKIENSDQTVDVVFPKGNISSTVKITDDNGSGNETENKKLDVTKTIVGGVDQIADQIDTGSNYQGKDVEVKLEVAPMDDLTKKNGNLTVEEQQTKQEQGKIWNEAKKANTATTEKKVEFLDLSLWMTVTENDQETTTNYGNDNTVLLSIVIPFDTSADGIKVYRCHNGSTETMKEDPVGDEEGFVIGKGIITIYAKKFSSYAVGYDVAASTPNPPAQDTPSYSGGDSSSDYTITVPKTENGKVTVSPKNASQGSTVKITVTPDEGYQLDQLTVTDKSGKEIELTDLGNGIYSFKMPGRNVDIKATFCATFAACAKDAACPIHPYTDASATAWYHDGVHYCIDNGIMGGYGNGIFKPNGAVTRQQVWLTLARLSGAKPADAAEARVWAMENGVSDGTNPTKAVTRQQFITMLYRYAVDQGYDVSVGEETNILSYTDAFGVAEYAVSAVQWGCGSGVMGGYTDGTLKPTATTTRAHLAAFLQRFCVEVA